MPYLLNYIISGKEYFFFHCIINYPADVIAVRFFQSCGLCVKNANFPILLLLWYFNHSAVSRNLYSLRVYYTASSEFCKVNISLSESKDDIEEDMK